MVPVSAAGLERVIRAGRVLYDDMDLTLIHTMRRSGPRPA
jgi:hypothetical protein